MVWLMLGLLSRPPEFAFPDHTTEVQVAVLSPDRRTLASAGKDHTIRVWDVASQTQRATLLGEQALCPSMAFSPDGKTLVTAGREDGSIPLWDATTGSPRATLRGHGRMGFGPDGRHQDSASPDLMVRMDALDAWLARVAFSPDGRHLASSWGRTVRLWDAPSGQELFRLNGHGNMLAAVAFSPDGKVLASAGYDMTIRLWDTSTGEERATLELGVYSLQHVLSMAFSPDGLTLAAGNMSGQVSLWDVTTGRAKAVFYGNNKGFIEAVAFSPDGTSIAAAQRPGRVWLAGVAAINGMYGGDIPSGTAQAVFEHGHPLQPPAIQAARKHFPGLLAQFRRFDEGQAEEVFSVFFRQDGSLWALGKDYADRRSVKLWQVTSRPERGRSP